MTKNKKMNVYVTGASGYIGSHVLTNLMSAGPLNIVALARNSIQGKRPTCKFMHFELETCGSEVFEPGSTIIHLAGIAHGKFKTIEEFEHINAKCSAKLATRAVECGVKRFIFLSSIGVHGNCSEGIIDESSPLQPAGAYAESKVKAETMIADACQNSNMELIILRPTLVYGRGAPGNISKLVGLFEKGIPVPFEKLNNKRNFCSVDKLTCLIRRLVLDDHNVFHLEKFVVADTNSKSVYAFMLSVAKLHDLKAKSLSLPTAWVEFLLKCIGKNEVISSLCRDLVVNTAKVDDYLEGDLITQIAEF